ncbi:hypothetical protein SDC9_159883 [bioreactor metagenome]|uniref:Uncharacterized protein n=1 Tax=bioreactor metagenome TaxID=1076179 RepID=A0A645FDU1_9ZZZZ
MVHRGKRALTARCNELRACHLAPAKAAHLAIKQVVTARLQPFGRIGAVKKSDLQQAGVVARIHPVQRAPAADAQRGVFFKHGRPHGAGALVRGLGHGVGVRIIHIVARVAAQQIAHRQNAQFGQLFCALFAHAFQVLDFFIPSQTATSLSALCRGIKKATLTQGR